MNNNNYISIQGFMVNDLHLRCNELLVYALIYGFSQDGKSWFQGSIKYISDWFNIDRKTVINVLQSLCDKGLLLKNVKTVNGVKLCDYMATQRGSGKNTLGVENDSTGSGNSSQGGSGNFSPHNNNIDNIIKEKEEEKESGLSSSFSSPVSLWVENCSNLNKHKPSELIRLLTPIENLMQKSSNKEIKSYLDKMTSDKLSDSDMYKIYTILKEEL